VARVCERLQDEQDIRVLRIGFPATTCPTTPALEERFYPNARTIASAVHQMVSREGSSPYRPWMPTERAEFKNIDFKGPF
jgi:pyruvate dehydrogenase E1 component beta subunit